MPDIDMAATITPAEIDTISKAATADFFCRFYRNNTGTFFYVKSPLIASFGRSLAGEASDYTEIPKNILPEYTPSVDFGPSDNGPDYLRFPLFYFRDVNYLPAIFQLPANAIYGKYITSIMRSPELEHGIVLKWQTPIRIIKARELCDNLKQVAEQSISDFMRPFDITVNISCTNPLVFARVDGTTAGNTV